MKCDDEKIRLLVKSKSVPKWIDTIRMPPEVFPTGVSFRSKRVAHFVDSLDAEQSEAIEFAKTFAATNQKKLIIEDISKGNFFARGLRRLTGRNASSLPLLILPCELSNFSFADDKIIRMTACCRGVGI